MKSVEEKIQAEIVKLNEQKEKLEAEKKKLEEKRGKTYDEKEEASKELKAKLEELRKPFDEKMEKIDSEKKETEHKIHQVERKIHTARYTIKANFYKNLKEFPDAETFKGFLILHKTHTSKIVMVKKKLPNGIQLFRHYDTWGGYEEASGARHISYFAVLGKRIVGFHHVDKAEHRGDYSNYQAWIGVKKIRRSGEQDLKFKEWKQKLTELTKFIEVDLGDENNREILKSTWELPSDRLKDGDNK